MAVRGRRGTDYDAELQRHNEVLRRAADVRRDDRVLDIGCGTGLTTRQAARAGFHALGVDVSATAIGLAREMARAAGVANVRFEHADAEACAFPRARFDLVISRFGTMFFDEPVAAFINILQAVRVGGRLAMLVWQDADRNEWAAVIRRCLESGSAAPPLTGPDAFSLADPTVVQAVLHEAGFVDVTLTEVREPVFYGFDVAAALDWIRAFATVSGALNSMDDEAASLTVGELTAAMAERLTGTGVWFDSRAWLVTARCP